MKERRNVSKRDAGQVVKELQCNPQLFQVLANGLDRLVFGDQQPRPGRAHSNLQGITFEREPPPHVVPETVLVMRFNRRDILHAFVRDSFNGFVG